MLVYMNKESRLVMNKEIMDKRLKGLIVGGQWDIPLQKLSFNQAIVLRDELISVLADMGEPVYFDSEYVCTTDLLDCFFETEHDCS